MSDRPDCEAPPKVPGGLHPIHQEAPMFDFDVVTGPTHGTGQPAQQAPAAAVPHAEPAPVRPPAAEPTRRPGETDARRAA